MAEIHDRTTVPIGIQNDILDAQPNVSKDVFKHDHDSANDHLQTEHAVNLQDTGKDEAKEISAISFNGRGEEIEAAEPFVPFAYDPGVPEEDKILRIRSIVLGCICGALVNASNVYLGELQSECLHYVTND